MKHQLTIGLVLMCMSPVFAHGVSSGGSFTSGLSHPALGFDHLLAMVSVGMMSAQMGGKAIFLVPLNFVMMMVVGAALGILGYSLPFVETGIAFSVLVLGLALAADRRFPAVLAFMLVSCFAIFHGHAHGMEMPVLAEPVLFAFGFTSGTAGIHLVGVLIGLFAMRNSGSRQVLRYIGASIACIGFYLLLI